MLGFYSYYSSPSVTYSSSISSIARSFIGKRYSFFTKLASFQNRLWNFFNGNTWIHFLASRFIFFRTNQQCFVYPQMANYLLNHSYRKHLRRNINTVITLSLAVSPIFGRARLKGIIHKLAHRANKLGIVIIAINHRISEFVNRYKTRRQLIELKSTSAFPPKCH